MRIRRVEPDEWRLLRDVRLRALAEAPYAFATTHSEAASQPDPYWHGMLRQPAWIAEEKEEWLGMVRARPEDEETAHLISMWVDPAARGAGVGRRLVEAVVEWAQAQGLRRVVLWVAEGNAAAETLYRSTGFVRTGDRQPLPSDPTTYESMMRLDLDAAR